jgi:hypothetical protein
VRTNGRCRLCGGDHRDPSCGYLALIALAGGEGFFHQVPVVVTMYIIYTRIDKVSTVLQTMPRFPLAR